MTKLKTAESVCAGHPDKMCDYIADSILTECLRRDRNSRVACEVMATKGKIIVAGEITCSRRVPIRRIVNRALYELGYNPLKYIVYNFTHKQSSDISNGVNNSIESRDGDKSAYSKMGAGDQGTVYGYACDETSDYLPMPFVLAQKICERLDYVRKYNIVPNLMPDGKAQVTVEYKNGKPKRVKTVVVSIQHKACKSQSVLKDEIISEVLQYVFDEFPLDENTEVFINPSGRFVEGGPSADTGLTGRKLMVDTYGGLAPHGGGAFSGKDATKVDRSGAYMARYIAKNIVFSGLAKECLVSISYAIGKADPVSVEVDSFGTSKYSNETLARIIMKAFNMRPAYIIDHFNLRNKRFSDYSHYGHFGNGYPEWEHTNKFVELTRVVRKYGN